MNGRVPLLSGPEVSADAVNAVEVRWRQIRGADGDAEALLQEDHKLQQAERIQDAAVQEWCSIRQWKQGRIPD